MIPATHMRGFRKLAVMAMAVAALVLLAAPAAGLAVPRRHFLGTAGAAGVAGFTAAGRPRVGLAETTVGPKQTGLSNDEIAAVVRRDLVEGQFLVTGQLTRSVYDEAATFTDEIDTYTLDKWIKGTQKLFVGEASHVDLVGDVAVSDTEVSLRFSEVLAFNMPFQPKVDLTGKLVLKRGPDGLITSYREFWDKSVGDVLKSARI